ncbi:MAG: hypothetical protein ACRENH_03595, partial [Gemmatimonadaceae bacterium]
MRPHEPLVVRGANGHGARGMGCATCHHAANFDPAHVPGHPQWHLAPLTPTIVVFAQEADMVLLGAIALEGLNLRIDVISKELVPARPVLVAFANAA